MKTMTMKSVATAPTGKNEQPINYPPEYKVIFWHNDATPLGFVVFLLTKIFNYEETDAFGLMLKMQNEGKVIAASYIKSIAETKLSLAKTVAEIMGYPVKITIE